MVNWMASATTTYTYRCMVRVGVNWLTSAATTAGSVGVRVVVNWVASAATATAYN